jgi:hypothetical protein
MTPSKTRTSSSANGCAGWSLCFLPRKPGKAIRKCPLVLRCQPGAGTRCLQSPTERRIWGACLDAATSCGCIDDHSFCACFHTVPCLSVLMVLQTDFHSSSSVGPTSMEVMRNASLTCSLGPGRDYLSGSRVGSRVS